MQQPTTQLLAKNNDSKRPEFVRVICPYPVVVAGLARTLEQAGIRYGLRPPPEGVPYCVLLCADDVEGLPETLGHVREESPDVTILVCGLHFDLPLAHAALRAGAQGFIHAEMQPEQIVRAIKVAAEGEMVAPRALLEYLIAEKTVGLDALSARQREILKLVSEGLTNAQIAERLYLSESTVKSHLSAAYKLLGVKNRTEAAKLLRRYKHRLA